MYYAKSKKEHDEMLKIKEHPFEKERKPESNNATSPPESEYVNYNYFDGYRVYK